MITTTVPLADQATEAATQIASDGWQVFLAWIMTPTGAVLTLLLIGLGITAGVMNVLGRSIRIILLCVKIVVALLFIWIVGGILEAWGIPVRETIATLGSMIPTLLQHVGEFISQLFSVAG